MWKKLSKKKEIQITDFPLLNYELVIKIFRTDVQVLVVPNGKKDAALRPSFPTPPFCSFKQRGQHISTVIFQRDTLITFTVFCLKEFEIEVSFSHHSFN